MKPIAQASAITANTTINQAIGLSSKFFIPVNRNVFPPIKLNAIIAAKQPEPFPFLIKSPQLQSIVITLIVTCIVLYFNSMYNNSRNCITTQTHP